MLDCNYFSLHIHKLLKGKNLKQASPKPNRQDTIHILLVMENTNHINSLLSVQGMKYLLQNIRVHIPKKHSLQA